MPEIYRVTIQDNITYVKVPANTYRVATTGYQGIPGAAGAGATISIVTGEAISAYQVVAMVNGLGYIADPTDINHANSIIGLATQSGILGDSIVVAPIGTVSGGSFVANAIYYVGLTGTLNTTQLPIGAVWTKLIGIGESASKVIINMGETILL